MMHKEYDFDDQNIPEDYYESEEWLAYEDQIREHQEPRYNLHKPKIFIDHNWEALKQERLIPYVPPATIEKISNVSLMLWANKNFTDGNFQCDIYKAGIKEHYNKNLIFEVTPELTPKQYKIWDLVFTESALYNYQARRCKFYNKDHATDYSNEFAHFELWQQEKLLWACLIIEDWIIPMNITEDNFQESGNIRMTAPWKNKEHINDWYQKNI